MQVILDMFGLETIEAADIAASRPSAVGGTSPKVRVKVREWMGPALASTELVLDAQPPAEPHSNDRAGSCQANSEWTGVG